PHEPALGVLDPRLLFEHRVDFQKAVIGWIIVFIEHHFDEAVTLVHRLKESAESSFAFAPRLLGLLTLAYVPKPQKDQSISVPSQAASIQQDGATPAVREVALELDG